MPSSGSGTGTPIAPMPSAAIDVARPIPYTLLSLSRYARLMGINPAHFCRSTTSISPQVFPINSSCSSVWPRHSWQNHDQVSHEELAYAIQEAEEDIARVVGYYPGPKWISEDIQLVNGFFDHTYESAYGLGGLPKSVLTTYGRFIQGGQREAVLIGTATAAGGSLVFSDLDSDGVTETVTITLATAYTSTKGIKVYFAGMEAHPDWEIRPVRKIKITGGNVIITLDSWLLLNPEILSAFPTDEGFDALDLGDISNFVVSVEVYLERANPALKSCEFMFRPEDCSCGETDCAVCSGSTQEGCLYGLDHKNGVVVPKPASYDAASGLWLYEVPSCLYGEPRQVKLWYYAGEVDGRYSDGLSFDPLSDHWAEIIAWVATARLDRPLCGCGHAANVSEYLRTDLTKNMRDFSFFTTREQVDNPLGTRQGEILAWKKISRSIQKRPNIALV